MFIDKEIFSGNVENTAVIYKAETKTIINSIIVYSLSNSMFDLYIDNLKVIDGELLRPDKTFKIQDKFVVEEGSTISIKTFTEIQVKIDGKAQIKEIKDRCGKSLDFSDYLLKSDFEKYITNFKPADDTLNTTENTWTASKIDSVIQQANQTLRDLIDTKVSEAIRELKQANPDLK